MNKNRATILNDLGFNKKPAIKFNRIASIFSLHEYCIIVLLWNTITHYKFHGKGNKATIILPISLSLESALKVP